MELLSAQWNLSTSIGLFRSEHHVTAGMSFAVAARETDRDHSDISMNELNECDLFDNPLSVQMNIHSANLVNSPVWFVCPGQALPCE
jgi:hypothetical protein